MQTTAPVCAMPCWQTPGVPHETAAVTARLTPQTDPHHAVLFQPLRIGPVVAPNRFYQVPHCTGIADRAPNALAS